MSFNIFYNIALNLRRMLLTTDIVIDKNDYLLRFHNLLNRINKAEEQLLNIENKINDPVNRIQRELMKNNVYTANFQIVDDNYYNLTLKERAILLQCNVDQLCKSIIFENTAYESSSIDNDDITNSKYYLVITQYVSKINVISLKNFIHELRISKDRLSKKRFHFQLAPDDISLQLSGYIHNAITPIGLKVRIPIVICKKCTLVSPSILYLGGGKVNVKLSIVINDLIKVTNALVADNITDERYDCDSNH